MPTKDEAFSLEVQKRDAQENPRALRRLGKVPAVLYGEGRPTVSLTLEHNPFLRVFKKAGQNSIVELALSGENDRQKVLVHDIQFDPVRDTVAHVDFLRVSLDREVTTKVPVKTTGVAPAVKDLGGILVVDLRELEIRCKAKDLIQEIVVDVSGLAAFHSSIHVRDLQLPAGVKAMHDPATTVVTITTPKKEEEEAPKPVEGAEGAAPAEGAATEGAAKVEGAATDKKAAEGASAAPEKKTEKKK